LIRVDGERLADVVMFDDGSLAARLDDLEEPPMSEQLVRSFFTAITENRFDDAAALLDPDGGWWSLSKRAERPPLVQLDRIRKLSAGAKAPMSFTVGSVTEQDDRVAAEVAGYAAFDDRVYDNMYFFLIRVDGGRITNLRMYDDTLMGERVLRGDNPLPSHAR
jgi:ketosteroid isomerase-like protein